MADITDDEIRELQKHARGVDDSLVALCDVALSPAKRGDLHRIQMARKRCAKVLSRLRAVHASSGTAGSRMKKGKKSAAPYTSESLAVSRRMVALGPLYEERAIIHDLIWRYGHLQGTLRYLDRSEGKPVAEEAEKLRQEAWRRIEELPEGDLRTNLTRELENPRR